MCGQPEETIKKRRLTRLLLIDSSWSICSCCSRFLLFNKSFSLVRSLIISSFSDTFASRIRFLHSTFVFSRVRRSLTARVDRIFSSFEIMTLASSACFVAALFNWLSMLILSSFTSIRLASSSTNLASSSTNLAFSSTRLAFSATRLASVHSSS